MFVFPLCVLVVYLIAFCILYCISCDGAGRVFIRRDEDKLEMSTSQGHLRWGGLETKE